MIRWAYDTELDQPNNSQVTDSQVTEPKIIQIGVVFFDLHTGENIETKKWYINIGVKLSSFIKSLTGISQEEIDNGTDIKTAYLELVSLIKKHGAITQPVTWGSGDLWALRKEVMPLLNKDEKWILGQAELNVKAIFQLYAQLNQIKYRGGLGTSMKKLGLEFEGRAHDALVDAINTKTILLHMVKEGINVKTKS